MFTLFPCLKSKGTDMRSNWSKYFLNLLCIKRSYIGICNNADTAAVQIFFAKSVSQSIKIIFKINRIIKISCSFYL